MNAGIRAGTATPGGRLSPVAATLPLFVQQITTSRVWTAPGDGWAEFLVFGAGGSGALVVQGNVDTRAQGGAAGGTAFARRRVKAGQQFNFTLGAGGAGRSTSAPVVLNGNPGGVTTVYGPNLAIVIPGGLGGTGSANTATTISSQARSIPTGGDVNIPGGVAGAISGALSTSGAATGGAGVALGGVAPDSGSINEVNAAGAATGGAGVHPSASLTISDAASAGGGVSAPSTNTLLVNGWIVGAGGGAAPCNFAWNTMALTGASTAATTGPGTFSANATNWGTGSGGCSLGNNTGSGTGGTAVFGGSGAMANNNTTVNYGSGAVTYTGGSGGCAVTDATAGTNWYTGAGGQAFALVAFFPGD